MEKTMGIVTRYGSSSYDPTSTTQDRLPAEEREGHVKALCGTLEAVNGDSATSKYYVGSMPANARIDPESSLFFDAIAGATSVHLGTSDDPDCLVSALDAHLGGKFSAVSAVDIANYGKPFWKLQAGVTVDPVAHIPVFITVNNALTAGGTITWNLKFKTP
jgi:hypothetical protein